jgi:hypothetical protein
MRFDVSTWAELETAVQDYRKAASFEPLILVLITPGQIAYRFIIGQHGIARQDCDARGEARE